VAVRWTVQVQDDGAEAEGLRHRLRHRLVQLVPTHAASDEARHPEQAFESLNVSGAHDDRGLRPLPSGASSRTAPRLATQGRETCSVESGARMRRRVTFSRNLTLSLSRTCRCYCKYCAFATHQTHLHAPEEVERVLDEAVGKHRVKELLVLTGERPEVNDGVAERLRSYGFEDFVAYVVWVCEQALLRGLLPHPTP